MKHDESFRDSIRLASQSVEEFRKRFMSGLVSHDNRSPGNRIDNTFVYVLIETEDGGGGYFRVDVHPDVATRAGAQVFESWDDKRHWEYEHMDELGPAEFFVILDDNTDGNRFGL